MAYARLGPDSDVYLFKTLQEKQFQLFVGNTIGHVKGGRYSDPKKVYAKLAILKAQGLKIPEHTFERLKGEF